MGERVTIGEFTDLVKVTAVGCTRVRVPHAEIPPAWGPLYQTTMWRLDEIANQHGVVIDFVSAKEKYGRLILVPSIEGDAGCTPPAQDLIREVCDEAADASEHVCIVCGAVGEVGVVGGHVGARCPEHRDLVC